MRDVNDLQYSPNPMGNYLKPPGHPNHLGSYVSPNSSMCVNAAAKAGHHDAKRRMESYVPPPITDALVQDWIRDCRRHWYRCWVGPEGEVLCKWSDGRPSRPLDALDFATHFIRRYYPEYQTKEGVPDAE